MVARGARPTRPAHDPAPSRHDTHGHWCTASGIRHRRLQCGPTSPNRVACVWLAGIVPAVPSLAAIAPGGLPPAGAWGTDEDRRIMAMTAEPGPVARDAATDDTVPPARPRSGWLRTAVLLTAVAFLGGSVGWAVRVHQERSSRNRVDVGFAQDMITHHDQAVQMALIVLGDPTVPTEVRSAAREILIFQRYEIGLLNDSLARWDESVEGPAKAMGWMGSPLSRAKMPGLATEGEMDRLSDARGQDAAARFLALMTRHHQGGIEMASHAADHGRDGLTKQLATSIARNQRTEIVEYEMLRNRLELPIPEGLEPLAEGEGHASMDTGH